VPVGRLRLIESRGKDPAIPDSRLGSRRELKSIPRDLVERNNMIVADLVIFGAPVNGAKRGKRPGYKVNVTPT
jgi:hypothetical protein